MLIKKLTFTLNSLNRFHRSFFNLIRNSPKDKKPALRGDCPQCGTHITEWSTNCPSCDTRFAPCIVSGRPILEPQFWVCGSCKHRAIEQEIANRISCPLCHMPVR